MKKLTMVVVGMLATYLPAHSQITLETGQQYSCTFSTMSYLGRIPQGASPGGVVDVAVDPTSFQAGDRLLIEMFDDLPAGNPIGSRTLSFPLPTPDSIYVSGAWQDHQGSIRLTMLSGSARIEGIRVDAIHGVIQGLDIYSTTIVPEFRPSLIVYDGFDYEAGQSLEGNGHQEFSWGTNRWLKHFATSDWRVFSNSLSHPSVAPAGGHVAETNNSQGANYERRFAPVVFRDGDSIWFSFLVKVTQAASWNLYLTSGGLNSNEFGVTANSVTDYYSIRARIGVGYNGSAETIDLGQNITRLIVGHYRFSASNAEQLDLWVDPDITSEPQPGGPSSSNHIAHTRPHDLQPAGIDSVLLEDRSLGSLAFDELRVGTTWKDVVPSAVDRVVIDAITVNGSQIDLRLSKLSPGALTTVERTTWLPGNPTWDLVGQFVPLTSSTNWTQSTTDKSGFYRVRVR